MSFVIGTVNALVGQVIAVAEDGSSRTLKLGDAVLNTEVIRTVEGAQIEVALANGEAVSIANAGEWFAEQALTPQTLAQIQFQSTPIGTVNSVSGNAVAVAADGSERVLLAGDSIYPGEIIRTSPDSAIQIAVDGASPITIGGGDSWVATSDTYTPTQDFDPTAAASSDIDAIQAAILAGVDPTQNAEATAAGGETPTEDGGSSFVTLERTAAEVNPVAGFDTVGLNQTVTPFNEEPAFVAADSVAPTLITITATDVSSEGGTIVEGNNIVIRFTISEPSSTPITIQTNNGPVTIPAGETTADLTFPSRQDESFNQGDEVITTTVTGVTGGNGEEFEFADAQTETTVIDDGDATLISISKVTALEGSEAVFEASIGTAPTDTPLVIKLSNGVELIFEIGSTTAEAKATIPITAHGTKGSDTDDSITQELTASVLSGGAEFEKLSVVNGTLTIQDTLPTAHADIKGVDEGDSVTGNVLTDGTADDFGADGQGSITGVRAANGDTTSSVSTGVGGTITGAHGTLVLSANGDYTYQSTADDISADAQDVFVYTIKDADGDLSTTTLTIDVKNFTLVATDSDAQVDEAALSFGSNAASTAEAFTDTIGISGGTGPYTYTLDNGGSGTYGTLSLDANTGSYTYTLTSVFDTDPEANNAAHTETGAESFSYTVTDANGNTTTGTIVVDIVDDVPVASSDVVTISSGTYGPETGNVLNNDAPGADGYAASTVVGVAKGDTGVALDSAGTVGVEIDGDYGKLTISASGSYSYTRNAGTPGDVSDVFTYTIEDVDGDLAYTIVTVNIGNAGVTVDLPDSIDLTTASITVDEDGLDDDSNNDAGETATNTFTYTASDTPVDITIGGALVVENGALTGNQPAAGSYGTLTVTGFNASTGTVSYSYTLTSAVTDTTTVQDGDNTVTGAESFAVTVADEDGDTDTGNINVAIVDDVPILAGFSNSSFTATVAGGAVDVDYALGTNSGADLPTTLVLTNATAASGETVSLSESGGLWTGSVGGKAVFTVEIQGDNGGLVFTPLSASEPTVLNFNQSTAFSPTPSHVIGDVTITGNGDVNGANTGLGAGGDSVFDSGDNVKFSFGSSQTGNVSIAIQTSADISGYLVFQSGSTTWTTQPTYSFDVSGNTLVNVTGSPGNDANGDPLTYDSVTIYRNDGISAQAKINSISYTTAAEPDVYTVTAKLIDSDGDESATAQFTANVSSTSAPVVIDLDQDGTEYLSREAGVVFTDQSTGESVNTAWVGPDDGLLVIDANNSGTIDESREYVFTEWSETAATDMEAIAEVFDTNRDGVLDAQDDQWDQFRVWQDKDSDGQTDEGELVSLGDLMIESIYLTYVADSQDGTAADGDVVIHGQSVVNYADGSTTIAEDTSFAISEVDLLNTEDLVFEKSEESSVNLSANSSDASVYLRDLDINELLHKVVDDGTV